MPYRLFRVMAAFAFLAMSAPSPAEAHKDHQKKSAEAAAQREPGAATAAAPMGEHDMAGMADGMASGEGGPPPGHMMEEVERPTTFTGRLVDWVGRWHPSVVHFPIALFVVAGALEVVALVRRRSAMLETTRVLVALGALGAVVAVAVGWMAMGVTFAADEPLNRAHRWLGTSIAGFGLAAWWANERFMKVRGKAAGWTYAALLVLTIVAIAVNGFLGGALVHGLDHLNF